MKRFHCKALTLLLAGLLAAGTLAACNDTQTAETNPADTVAEDTQPSADTESSEETPAETETQEPTEETTAPEEETTAPEASEPTDLDATAAQALLSEALTAAAAKTNYESTKHQILGYDSTTLTDITVSYATAADGKNHRITTNVMGTESSYLLIGDTVYVTMPVSTGSGKYTLALTEDQKQSLLSGAVSEEAVDFSKILSAEAFIGLSGIQQVDGSATLTATDLSDAAKTALGAEEGLEVALSSCTLEMNTDGLITKLAISYTLTMQETDFTAAFTMNGSASVVTSYETVSLSVPEDAADYAEESYAAVFEGSVPLDSMMQAAQMLLTEDNYVIGDTASGANIEAQASLLAQFPHLYAGKNFTVSATVSADDFARYIEIGGVRVALECPQNLLGPVAGDVITVNAAFTYGRADNELDLAAYSFVFDSYELIERPAGPNGGTYMFVTASSLNVRTQPTTSGNTPIGALSYGSVVEVLAVLDGWAKIVFPEADLGYAYVSTQYLTES